MEYIINFYPIVKFLVLIFAVVGFFNFLQALTHAIKDTKLNTKTKELDNEVIQELIKKFPDVSEDFIKKSEKLQNIENNQEIHEINKKIRKLEGR